MNHSRVCIVKTDMHGMIARLFVYSPKWLSRMAARGAAYETLRRVPLRGTTACASVAGCACVCAVKPALFSLSSDIDAGMLLSLSCSCVRLGSFAGFGEGGGRASSCIP